MLVQLGLSRSGSLPMEREAGTQAPVQVTDMNEFVVEVCAEEAKVLRRVERRTRERALDWVEEERLKGPNWFTGLRRSHSISGAHIRENLSAHLARRRPGTGAAEAGNGLTQPQPAAGTTTTAVGLAALRPANIALKQLVRRGIPPHLRPEVWMAVSGAQRLKDEAGPEYYLSILREHEGEETESTHQIDSDLHRTFPGHPRLDTPEGLNRLRRVLVAYSFRDSHVGYCQGMNYVAAYLLLVMKDEVSAFWMLCTLVENVLFDDCFSEDLFGCHVEQRVLKDLLRAKKPRLCEHLDSIGFELSLVATEWFLCIFAKSFPSETTLRVWDVLFHEGAKVLFRVALALFQMNEQSLLTARHVGEAVGILVKSTTAQYDPDALLQVAFDKIGSFPMSAIQEKRRKQTPAVAAALEHRQQQLAAAAEARLSGALRSSSSMSSYQSAPSTKASSPEGGSAVPRVGSSVNLLDGKENNGGTACRLPPQVLRRCLIDRTTSI